MKKFSEFVNEKNEADNTLVSNLQGIYGKDIEVHGFSKERLLMRIKDKFVLKLMFHDGTESPGGEKFKTLKDAAKKWHKEKLGWQNDKKDIEYESDELLAIGK